MKPTSVITIFGGDSWVNRGDEAILRGTIELFNKLEPVPSIQILTGNRKKTENIFPNCMAINRNNPFSVVWAFFKSDLIAWGGGHLLQNTSSRVFLIHQLYILWIAIILNKSIMALCIGAERISGNLWRYLAKITLNHLEVITVRDRFTKKIIEDLGVSRPLLLAADPALLIKPSYNQLSLYERKPYFIASVRKWFDYKSSWFPVSWRRSLGFTKNNTRFEDLINTFAAGCDQIIEKYGLKVVFISMYPGHGQADEDVARCVIDRMRYSASASIQDPNEDFCDFQSLLSGAEFLIGMRMHATILSASANRPVIAVYYQNKGKEFLDNIGQSKLSIPVENLTEKSLMESVDYLIANSAEIRTTISKSIDRQKESFSPILDHMEKVLYGK